jgi:hypothetical protein
VPRLQQCKLVAIPELNGAHSKPVRLKMVDEIAVLTCSTPAWSMCILPEDEVVSQGFLNIAGQKYSFSIRRRCNISAIISYSSQRSKEEKKGIYWRPSFPNEWCNV